MSNSYSVSSSPALSSTLIGIYGQVNSKYVFIMVYQSALEQAYASNGQPGTAGRALRNVRLKFVPLTS